MRVLHPSASRGVVADDSGVHTRQRYGAVTLPRSGEAGELRHHAGNSTSLAGRKVPACVWWVMLLAHAAMGRRVCSFPKTRHGSSRTGDAGSDRNARRTAAAPEAGSMLRPFFRSACALQLLRCCVQTKPTIRQARVFTRSSYERQYGVKNSACCAQSCVRCVKDRTPTLTCMLAWPLLTVPVRITQYRLASS